jgi:hypothetical protein
MTVGYSEPFSRGFNRMKKALFQPFNLTRWINIGFTSFLATLTQCSGGSGGGNNAKIQEIMNFNMTEFFQFPELAHDWMVEHPLWLGLIIMALVFIFLIIAVLTWISSRGKFMFLFNVINNTDSVIKPWHEFRKQGDSLFRWQFVYGLVVLMVFILLAVYGFGVAKNIYTGVMPEITKFSFIFGFVVTIFALLMLFGYISLFLNDFIVPIMYKHNCSATRAWSKLFTLLLMNPGNFILYGLFVLALSIAIAISILILAIGTCCVGLVFLVIPFVRSVVLLPVSYTFRAFSIEFLAQFGDNFEV